MFQTFGLWYYCGNYCMEILHFCIKIWNYFTSVEVNERIYLLNYNCNLLDKKEFSNFLKFYLTFPADL